jgi:hypothetical protein
MADFGTGRDKKSHDYDVAKEATDHAVRLSGAFRRVNDKLRLRKIPDHRPGILPNSSSGPIEKSQEASYLNI